MNNKEYDNKFWNIRYFYIHAKNNITGEEFRLMFTSLSLFLLSNSWGHSKLFMRF